LEFKLKFLLFFTSFSSPSTVITTTISNSNNQQQLWIFYLPSVFALSRSLLDEFGWCSLNFSNVFSVFAYSRGFAIRLIFILYFFISFYFFLFFSSPYFVVYIISHLFKLDAIFKKSSIPQVVVGIYMRVGESS
jgi:hypothetical protein